MSPRHDPPPRRRADVASDVDALVVGGGHNGLVAAAYLARAGLRTVVLEARSTTGGAATTETPWGPDFKMTALSYVMSLMPPTIIRDLSLEAHGYHVVPMGPSFVAFPDGRYLYVHDDPTRNVDEVAKFSRRDAERLPEYEAWLHGVADVLAPLLLRTPPRIGSRRPRDLLDQLRTAWGLRGLDVRGTAEATRLFTMSIRDLLDEWFESAELKGVLAINGVIGTWAGPDEPGTAYVMMHHTIGDVGDGQLGSWGYPIGGMGAVSDAIRRSAESFGATILTDSPVASIDVLNGKVRGATTAAGRTFRAPIVVAATHPQITFLRQIDRAELPADFVRDIERWRSRSGTVKVNVALSSLPNFTAWPGDEPHEKYTGAIELCHSIDYVERAFQDAREGRAAARPFSDSVIPSTLDRTLCPDGTHVMSMFTQWVPESWSDEPHPAELEAYADRVIAGYDELAPGFARSVIHRQVIGPYEMEHEYGLIGGNIFHGELTPDQLFHMRPAPGYADFTTPIDGLYQCSSATHGGGGVTGIPALLCTRRILSDHRRARLLRRSPIGRAAVGEPIDPARDPPGRARRRARSDDERLHAAGRRVPRRPRPRLGTLEPVRRRLGVRREVGRARRAGRTRRRRRRRRPGRARARRRRGAARLLQLLPSPRPRADARAARPTTSARSSARTTAGGTGSTVRCCRPRTSRRPTASTARCTVSTPVAVEEWHGWAMVDVTGLGPAAAPLPRRSRGPDRAVRARTADGRRHPLVRDRRQLEADRRELPGVRALPAHPSRAVRGEPGRERREPRRARRHVDRRMAGPATACRHDVAHRRQRRGDAPRPRRPRPAPHRLPRPAAEPARQPAPRLRDDPPARPARRRPHGDRVPVAVRSRCRRRATTSTRRTRSTSGTSPTARTGPPARRCNAVSARVATGRGRSAPTRTPSPASPASSPTPTSTARSRSREVSASRAVPTSRGAETSRDRVRHDSVTDHPLPGRETLAVHY